MFSYAAIYNPGFVIGIMQFCYFNIENNIIKTFFGKNESNNVIMIVILYLLPILLITVHFEILKLKYCVSI